MSVPPGHEDVPLGPMTTLGVGGMARRFVDVSSVKDLAGALEWARGQGWSTLILGDGSNLVVGDRGFDGLVVRLSNRRMAFVPDGAHLNVWADAGVSWDRLVDEAVARNAAGIECLTGIPGRVGAAPIQNIGAYGQEVSHTVVAVEALERATGRTVTFAHDDCDFGYRTSRFKRERDAWVVTRVQLRLRQGGAPTLSYADLRARIGDGVPSLPAVRALVRDVRAQKSMLRIPGDPNYRSAGSFFVNPIVSTDVADRVAATAAQRTNARVPRYPAGDGQCKLSAAWLIEQSGFAKGWGEGRVGLSTRHTLALVNRGDASAAELRDVALQVRAGVYAAFGVTLVPEPVMVGLDWPPLAAEDVTAIKP